MRAGSCPAQYRGCVLDDAGGVARNDDSRRHAASAIALDTAGWLRHEPRRAAGGRRARRTRPVRDGGTDGRWRQDRASPACRHRRHARRPRSKRTRARRGPVQSRSPPWRRRALHDTDGIAGTHGGGDETEATPWRLARAACRRRDYRRAGWRQGKARLVGTAIGGGAGTAAVLSTRGKEVHLAEGAALTVRLTAPVTVVGRG